MFMGSQLFVAYEGRYFICDVTIKEENVWKFKDITRHHINLTEVLRRRYDVYQILFEQRKEKGPEQSDNHTSAKNYKKKCPALLSNYPRAVKNCWVMKNQEPFYTLIAIWIFR